jgi:hypothetical protein
MPLSIAPRGRRSLLRRLARAAILPAALPQGTVPAARALAQPAAEPITLAALMAMLAAVPARRTRFRETRHFAALSFPLVSEGTLLYRRPDHLEKLTDGPGGESLVVNGDRIALTPFNEPTRFFDLSARPELTVLIDAVRAPLAGDRAKLERAFTVQLDGTASAWRLVLAPRDPRAARLLRAVRIVGTGDALTEVVTEQPNGDVQRLEVAPSAGR